MAITGTFVANFDQFNRAVDGANTRLRGLTDESAKVERQVTRIGDASKSLRQFDDVLKVMGVDIGPVTRGLGDLEHLAGQSEAKMSAFAKASQVAGAAIAGWQVGRWIADLTKSDQLIGNITAKLFGFGDVAKEQAAAGADVLARASANAGRSITSMAEAIEINRQAAAKAIATNQQLAASYERIAAVHKANEEKIAETNRQSAAAFIERRNAEAAAYVDMQKNSADFIKQAEADLAASQALERQFAAEQGRAHQEADIAALQARTAAGGSNWGAAYLAANPFRGAPLPPSTSTSVQLGPPASIATTGGAGGGGSLVTVNVSGVFDPATANLLAKVVNQELTRALGTTRRRTWG